MENDAQKRAMYLQSIVVLNVAEPFESVHKKIHSLASRTDHLREGLLAYIWYHCLGLSGFSEAGLG
jgi:hypothetical protein